MSYSDDYRRKVFEAFADALNRIAAFNREPDEQEGAALLSALSAMATDAYGIAEKHISEVFIKRLRVRPQMFPGVSVTVEGLRAALAQELTRSKFKGRH